MNLLFDSYVTAVTTLGWTVLPNTWSEQLQHRLVAMPPSAPNFRLIREAYDGLPMRVAREVAGEQIFSSARVGVPAGWYRARTETCGSPHGFIPGLCILGPVSSEGARLSVIPGSAWLDADAAVPADLAVHHDLAAGDVAILDPRCMQQWTAAEAVFQLRVVRPWVQPEQDLAGMVDSRQPPRAARFAGLSSQPAASFEMWLFERHEKRP